jgi:hypothetical protein
MIQYIPGAYSGLPLNSLWGDKLREKIKGGKKAETFFSAL